MTDHEYCEICGRPFRDFIGRRDERTGELATGATMGNGHIVWMCGHCADGEIHDNREERLVADGGVPEHYWSECRKCGEETVVLERYCRHCGFDRQQHRDEGLRTDGGSGGVETDTKFVEFDSPSLARSFRFMVTRFEPERQSIPHGSGYADNPYRQYVWIAQNSKLQVTDNDIYGLIDKIDEFSHQDHRDSEFWEFLRWYDGVSWEELPEQYRAAEGAWGEGA